MVSIILIDQTGFVPDRFGLLGLLSVIRMTDPDLNTLALGTDLTTLGLNLNSPDCLYATFASPFADGPSKREPDFYLPSCYYTQPPMQPASMKIQMFTEETLLYIFYSMPRDILQLHAATELYMRDWRYHKEHKLWFTRVPSTEPLVKTTTYERGSYFYFDPNTWEKIRKDNFVLCYDQIDTPPKP
jgi:CCR4-NOT transcription complex subunit 2